MSGFILIARNANVRRVQRFKISIHDVSFCQFGAPLHLGDYDHPVVLLAALRGCTPGKNGSKSVILILLASKASFFDS